MAEVLLILPLIIISVGLTIYALLDFVRRDPREIRGNVYWVWLVVILLFSIIGPVAYLTFGRREV